MRRVWQVLAVWLVPAWSLAAQVVVMDLKPAGAVNADLAAALTPVLVTELARVQGLSVVSQADVRALLENEVNKQALGCEDPSCMTDIADNLGAELLLSGTVSKVGNTWTVALTLMRAANGEVIRRQTGTNNGGNDAAKHAMTRAVADLMREGLPADVQGPASLSRRGFEAALRGYQKALTDVKADIRDHRRRLILDLVSTELDYDAAPKLDMLDLAIRRGYHPVETGALTAKDAKDLQRFINARGQLGVLHQDLQRVKEIRTRARERGLVPSASPLRFEDPDPPELPDAAAVQEYIKTSHEPRKVVEQAIKAYGAKDEKAWTALWLKDSSGNAERAFKDAQSTDAHYGYTYDVLPLHAHPPWLLKAVLASLDDKNRADETVILLRRYAKGKIDDERRVTLKKDGAAWRIKSAW
jgi:TolB-like protein